MLKYLKNIIKKIVIWWKAEILNYPYWRVEDQKNNDCVVGFFFKNKAKSIAREVEGKAFIDYAFIIMRDKDAK